MRKSLNAEKELALIGVDCGDKNWHIPGNAHPLNQLLSIYRLMKLGSIRKTHASVSGMSCCLLE